MTNLVATLGLDPLAMIVRRMRDLLTHLFHRARHFISDFYDFQVLNKVLDLGRHTVATRDCFTERDGLADHAQIRAACATKFQFIRRLCAALRTEHGVSSSLYAVASKVVQLFVRRGTAKQGKKQSDVTRSATSLLCV